MVEFEEFFFFARNCFVIIDVSKLLDVTCNGLRVWWLDDFQVFFSASFKKDSLRKLTLLNNLFKLYVYASSALSDNFRGYNAGSD
jgi:hypothetical protein